jgi:AraC-like DNA-binding protein
MKMEHAILPPLGRSVEIYRERMGKASDMPSPHSHEYHEIYFLLSGERRYLLGHKIYNVDVNNAVIIPKNEIHRTTTPGVRGYDRYVVYFYDEILSSLNESIKDFDTDRFFSLGCVEFPAEVSEKIKNALIEMQNEYESPDTYSEEYIKGLLKSIIILILRHGRAKKRDSEASADKIQYVAKYIRSNFYENITLESAAKLAFMEKTYFSKRFKALTGFGVSEYLCEIRIREAEKLLRYTNLSISEISERCGFGGSNYFGDAFKRYMGLSPREYRKKRL